MTFSTKIRELGLDHELRKLALKHGVTVAQIGKGRKALRKHDLDRARGDAMLLTQERLHLSYPQVAAIFGCGDHVVALRAIRKARARRDAARVEVLKQEKELDRIRPGVDYAATHALEGGTPYAEDNQAVEDRG